MKKQDELRNENSCLNKADMKEMLFVLLGRDKAAPQTIRFWAGLRVSMEKNRWNDNQIQEALECANSMEEEQRKDGTRKGNL